MSLTDLPGNLPAPIDDGATNHLLGTTVPDLSFVSTAGETVNIGQFPGRTVFYIYPMTGRPDTALPDGWDEIPGARGCTPQSCGFRDHYAELKALTTEVVGLSAQSTTYQLEAKKRLDLPFELLSDENLSLKSTLNLPTFTADGMELYKRITFIAKQSRIIKVFYPVFPPSENAEQLIDWLQDTA